MLPHLSLFSIVKSSSFVFFLMSPYEIDLSSQNLWGSSAFSEIRIFRY